MAGCPALIDGESGAYGVTFPDLPGIAAMGPTLDEVLLHAEEALSDASVEAERDGAALEPAGAIEDVAVPAGSAAIPAPSWPAQRQIRRMPSGRNNRLGKRKTRLTVASGMLIDGPLDPFGQCVVSAGSIAGRRGM